MREFGGRTQVCCERPRSTDALGRHKFPWPTGKPPNGLSTAEEIESMATAKKIAKSTAKPAASNSSRALPGVGDLGRMVEKFKIPGIDVAAIVEVQSKDMEALAEANRLAYEGIKTLADRRNQILKESLSHWQEAMKAAAGPDALSKQAELARDGVQRAMANMRELAEMEAAARSKAWKVVQDRFQENLADLQKMLQPKK
jgi:phasin family protein